MSNSTSSPTPSPSYTPPSSYCAELHDLLENWPASNLLHCYYEIRCENSLVHYLVKILLLTISVAIWKTFFSIPRKKYLDDFKEYCSEEDRRESIACMKRTNDKLEKNKNKKKNNDVPQISPKVKPIFINENVMSKTPSYVESVFDDEERTFSDGLQPIYSGVEVEGRIRLDTS